MRLPLFAVSVACVFAASSSASAVGALAARPAETSIAASGEVAIAVTETHVTTWARTRFVGAADAVAWLVPVPPGAVIDVAAPGWLDALEDVTAPRILAPAKQPDGATCQVPAPSLVSSGDAASPPAITAFAIVDDAAALATTLAAWGFAAHALDDAAGAALDAGQRLLVLELAAPAGTSPTLRIHAPIGAKTMLLSRSPLREPFTLWLFGDGRASLAGVSTAVLAPDAIGWTSATSTSYADAREALLIDAAHGVLEMSAPALAKGKNLPSGGAVPGLVAAYLARVPGAAGQSDAIAGALAKTAILPEACARGDLSQPVACASAPSPLDALATGDDLRFALAGAPSARWLSRITAVAPVGTSCTAPKPAFAPGPELPAITHAGSWGPLCNAPAATSTPPPASHGGGSAPDPVPPDDPSADDDTAATPPGDPPPATIVNATADMACSSSSDTTADGSSKSSGCSGDSSGAPSESSGCSSRSSGSSSENSGCSSSSSGSSSGSSGCSSSSGGSDSSSSTCSVGDRPARPLRLSRLIILLAGVALPLRRSARRKRPIDTLRA